MVMPVDDKNEKGSSFAFITQSHLGWDYLLVIPSDLNINEVHCGDSLENC
jgi:hypothetical protein